MFDSKKRMRSEIDGLADTCSSLQQTITVLMGDIESSESKYSGNPYKTYAKQVAALEKKYNGLDDWGNQICRNILEVRSAFVVGNGVEVRVKKDGKGDDEVAFIREIMRRTKLDSILPHHLAIESEIEGKIAVRIMADKGKEQLDFRYIPWSSTAYKIETKKDDYGVITRMVYRTAPNEGENCYIMSETDAVKLDPSEFAFVKFGGRLFQINETYPKCGGILRNMEDIDKALTDWRKINHLFAAPTPDFEVETMEQAEEMRAKLATTNWKIGKVLVHTGKFNLKSLSIASAEVLQLEIESHAKIISGNTGVPVHFLGFPDLMSNRSAAENLLELVFASVAEERKAWIGFYRELFRKALVLSNQNFSTAFDPDALIVDMPQISNMKMRELAEVWLPMYLANTISLRTFLSHIPDIIVNEELEELKIDPDRMPRSASMNINSDNVNDMTGKTSGGRHPVPDRENG